MRVPIISGVVASETGAFLVSYPINREPILRDLGIADGYLAVPPGITTKATTGFGADRGGINWNNVCYRGSAAFAADTGAILGGAIGGGAGAAIGSSVGGRNGAIIGGALGGATGAAIATNNNQQGARVAPARGDRGDRGDRGEHEHEHRGHHHEHDD